MTYTYPELCALFKLSPLSNQMRKRLVALQQSGFPPPLPGGGGRWSKPAVDAWMHNWGKDLSPSPALGAGEGGRRPDEGTPPQNPAIARMRQALHQIYN